MARAASRKPAPALVRTPALAGKDAAFDQVTVSLLPFAARLSLRAPEASVASLSRALGLKLPQQPKASAVAKGGDFGGKGGRAALWLGPDEWLVIDDAGGDPVADCANARALHAAVDISHRNVAFAVSGKAAAAVVNAGCPQDLSPEAFPVGASTRTVLGKIEIVLLRTGEEAFRIECWRSFADYAFAFLSDAGRGVTP